MQLFAEIFPLESHLQIVAYGLFYDADMPAAYLPRIGRSLVRRLKKAYPGAWLWSGSGDSARLLTTEDRSEIELNILLDFARDEDPDLYMFVDTLALDPDFQPDARTYADFMLRTKLAELEKPLENALAKFNSKLATKTGMVRAEREYKLTPWIVGGQPALSLSISARLVYEQDAQTFAETMPDPAALKGLRAKEKHTGLTGEIVKITGTVGERRPHMLSVRAVRTMPPALQQGIQHTPVGTLAVRLRTSGGKKRALEVPASALEPLIRPSDFARFGLDPKQANPALRPDPATRSLHVKALSDIAKEAGVLARAYNSREASHLFIVPDPEQPSFQPYLRFSNKRTRPYKLDTLAVDFRQCGAYHLRETFANAPVRVAVVNAVPMKIEDFVEALQRAITRSFEFKIEVVRERRVRVVSLANVAAAVEVVEEEKPDIVLVFLPDQAPDSAEDEDLVAYVKSLTLGRGLPAHVIFQSTLDDPESMPGIIMSILARTGNTPFALADPLEFAHFVVGLDDVRQQTDDEPKAKKRKKGAEDDPEPIEKKITAVARIYRNDGIFMRWAVRSMVIKGDEPPYVLMRDLFPQRDFAKKRVVIHYEGRLPEDVRTALNVWGKALGAVFYVVELVRRGAPRLYTFDEGKIVAPPPGSAFKVNDHEAFFVLAHDPEQPTPQPIHVISQGLPIENALHSLRMWTLLYYTTSPDGQMSAPLLPVTLQGAGELAYWLRKGNTFATTEGEVPFWL